MVVLTKTWKVKKHEAYQNQNTARFTSSVERHENFETLSIFL